VFVVVQHIPKAVLRRPLSADTPAPTSGLNCFHRSLAQDRNYIIKRIIIIITIIIIRGKVFTACVRSTMLHGSETWAPNASDLQRLRRNDHTMIRWICGAKLEDEIPSAVLQHKLDLDEITAVLRTRRLRWYRHVQRATSCINSITQLGLPGTRDRGRPRKTWSACVRNDMTICNLDGGNPLERNSWRTSVRRCQVLPTPESGPTASP